MGCACCGWGWDCLDGECVPWMGIGFPGWGLRSPDGDCVPWMGIAFPGWGLRSLDGNCVPWMSNRGRVTEIRSLTPKTNGNPKPIEIYNLLKSKDYGLPGALFGVFDCSRE